MFDEAVRAWLRVADDDLRAALAARACLSAPDPITTAAAYHCQQAAEKLVKAVLVSTGLNPPKSHNIAGLIDALPGDHDLRPTLTALERFTPFVAVFRYPGADLFDEGPAEPDAGEVSAWIAQIEGIRAAVLRHLGMT